VSLSPEGILNDQLRSFGLTYSAGSYSHACANVDPVARSQCQTRLDEVIENAIRTRARRMSALKAETMKSIQSALTGLVKAHEQFDAGESFDLSAVTQQVSVIRSNMKSVAVQP
jgi:hypothetical protein